MKTDPLRPLETTWEDWVLGGGARTAFERPELPLEVEIGPGEDDFLLDRAVETRDRNWLGIEYSRKRIRRYVRKTLDRAGILGNLRLIWRPAADLVLPFLSPALVHAYHVYFPDPWPKKHHHRYRLMTASFLGAAASSLVPGGAMHILTDSRDYAEAMVEAADGAEGLTSRMPEPGYELLTEGDRRTVFEDRWRVLGHMIYRLELRRPEGR